MKLLLLIVTTFPFLSFSQQFTKAISLTGGGEYYDSNTHAWNLGLSYNQKLANTNKFWSEFGVNYSVLEYKGDSGIKIDTTPPYPANAAVGISTSDGYVRRHSSHYTRTSALRMKAGINYTLLNKEKIRVSTGINVTNQILLKYREHGQRIYVPGYEEDTLAVIYSQYSATESLSNTSNAITILFQPHVDVAIPISKKLCFTSRLAYYWQVLPTVRHSRAQLNLGIRYQWK